MASLLVRAALGFGAFVASIIPIGYLAHGPFWWYYGAFFGYFSTISTGYTPTPYLAFFPGSGDLVFDVLGLAAGFSALAAAALLVAGSRNGPRLLGLSAALVIVLLFYSYFSQWNRVWGPTPIGALLTPVVAIVSWGALRRKGVYYAAVRVETNEAMVEIQGEDGIKWGTTRDPKSRDYPYVKKVLSYESDVPISKKYKVTAIKDSFFDEPHEWIVDYKWSDERSARQHEDTITIHMRSRYDEFAGSPQT